MNSAQRALVASRQTLTDGGTIEATSSYCQLDSLVDVTTSVSEAIEPGETGQELLIENVGTKIITIKDAAGTKILSGDLVLDPGEDAYFIWNGLMWVFGFSSLNPNSPLLPTNTHSVYIDQAGGSPTGSGDEDDPVQTYAEALAIASDASVNKLYSFFFARGIYTVPTWNPYICLYAPDPNFTSIDNGGGGITMSYGGTPADDFIFSVVNIAINDFFDIQRQAAQSLDFALFNFNNCQINSGGHIQGSGSPFTPDFLIVTDCSGNGFSQLHAEGLRSTYRDNSDLPITSSDIGTDLNNTGLESDFLGNLRGVLRLDGSAFAKLSFSPFRTVRLRTSTVSVETDLPSQPLLGFIFSGGATDEQISFRNSQGGVDQSFRVRGLDTSPYNVVYNNQTLYKKLPAPGALTVNLFAPIPSSAPGPFGKTFTVNDPQNDGNATTVNAPAGLFPNGTGTDNIPSGGSKTYQLSDLAADPGTPQILDVTTLAGNVIPAGAWFQFSTANNTSPASEQVYVPWATVDGIGVAPVVPGAILIPYAVLSTDSDADVLTALINAVEPVINGNSAFTTQEAANEMSITDFLSGTTVGQIADGTTPTGFTLVVTDPGTDIVNGTWLIIAAT